MEEGRVLFDASAYMLFEASGDSEAEYFEPESDAQPPPQAAEDDAQSCSYGSLSDSPRLNEIDSECEDFRVPDFDYCEVDDGGGSDEEDGVVDQCCGGAAAAKEKPMKSKGFEDSNVKIMNEREGDRLFWEACLAS